MTGAQNLALEKTKKNNDKTTILWNKSNIRVVVCFWSKWLTIWWVRSVSLCWQLSAECRKTQTPPSCYPDSVGARFLWHTQAHSLICLLRAGHHNIDSWNHPHKSDTTQSEKIKHFCCNIKVSMIINSKNIKSIQCTKWIILYHSDYQMVGFLSSFNHFKASLKQSN